MGVHIDSIKIFKALVKGGLLNNPNYARGL